MKILSVFKVVKYFFIHTHIIRTNYVYIYFLLSNKKRVTPVETQSSSIMEEISSDRNHGEKVDGAIAIGPLGYCYHSIEERERLMEHPKFHCSILHESIMGEEAHKIYGNKRAIIRCIVDHIETFKCNLMPLYFANGEFINELLLENPNLLRFMPEKWKDNERFFRDYIKQSYLSYTRIIGYFSEDIQKNKQLLKDTFMNIENAGKDFRSKLFPHQLKFLHKSFLNDRDVMLYCIKQDVDCLRLTPKWMKQDTQFMIEAMMIHSGSFNYIEDDLKKNGRFLLNALSLDPRLVRHMDLSFVKSVDFSLQCIEKTPEAYKYFPEKIKDNDTVIMKLIKRGRGNHLDSIPRYKLDNKKIVNYILSNTPDGYKHLTTKWKNNKKITMDAIQNNGMMMKHTPDKLKKDHTIIREALVSNPYSYQYLLDIDKMDKEYIKMVLKQNAVIFRWIPEKSPLEDKEFLLEVVKYDHVYDWMFAELKKDMEIIWMKKKYYKPISRINKTKNMFFHFRS